MITKVLEKCTDCGICKNFVVCPAGDVKRSIESDTCIGCGACTIACPEEALILERKHQEKKKVFVDDKEVMASGTVKDALIASGIKISKFPVPNQIFMPCSCGACWACLVMVNEKLAPGCHAPLEDGMKIKTKFEEHTPVRVVSGFGAHSVGGVGTPYWLKGLRGPIEVVGFAHGCNLRCPQCQNHIIAFTAGGHLLEAYETAQILLGLKEHHKVSRIAISGGECTLNRRWLLEVIRSIRSLDENVHIHVDTNGTILTYDYIDELVDAGMTDVGVDIKSKNLKTFMHITGLDDKKIAKKYLETSWEALGYIIDEYPEDIFLGIGIPYNKALISKKEVEDIGHKIYKMNDEVQICILDYRPEFRRKNLKRPSFYEMLEIKDILNNIGLKTVVAQTLRGHFGP